MGLFKRIFHVPLTTGVAFTSMIWILVCYQFLSNIRSQFDENNAFNLVDDLPLESHDQESLPDFHFESVELKTTEDNRKMKKFKVVDKNNQNKTLSYGEFLLKIETSEDFLEDFNDVLKRGLQSFSDTDMTPYFFETPPVTIDDMNKKEFEFVLIAAHEFNQASPQPEAFEKYFKRCSSGVVGFPNLGNDALYVVPCKLSVEPSDTYSHLANFVRKASDEQIHTFWLEVSRQMRRRLEEKAGEKVWMSTCGLGIFWLHVRMDSNPKFYSYSPYRYA